MARYTGPDCKLCRREKTKLFLKGAKCDSPKCPIEIRPYPPGEHGRNRPEGRRVPAADPGEAEGPPDLRHPGAAVPRLLRGSDPQARPDRRDPAPAARAPPGQRRLPGRASPRAATWPASWCTHGHFLVNGKKVDIPSYRVSENDIVEVMPKFLEMTPFVIARAEAGERTVPAWLEVIPDKMRGPGALAARPGADRHPGPGAAHRRVLLEVSPARLCRRRRDHGRRSWCTPIATVI